MASSGARDSTATPCIEIKRLDPGVVNRTYDYPGLAKGTKVLVVGDGAVGDSARSLLKAAGCQVTALCTAATAAATTGCLAVEGSPTSPDACVKAVAGQEVVVHAGGPSCAAEARECVTSGTRNLLEAAAVAGVKGFVFASSVSVVSGGKTSKAISEDTPYPTRNVDPAAAALAEAERLVLRANATNAADGMLTCSVRAAPVYGPGESERLIPGLACRAKAGVRAIGDGSNVVDFVYSGNVAHALILAAQRLLSPAQPAAAAVAAAAVAAAAQTASAATGRAYFVTDVEPVPYGEFAGRALSRLGYPAPGSGGSAGAIPVALALALAFLLRVAALVVSPIFELRPALTARRVSEESEVRRFDTSRAREELGYAPRWTQDVRSRSVRCTGSFGHHPALGPRAQKSPGQAEVRGPVLGGGGRSTLHGGRRVDHRQRQGVRRDTVPRPTSGRRRAPPKRRGGLDGGDARTAAPGAGNGDPRAALHRALGNVASVAPARP